MKRSSESGMTLIEVLIAVTLLTLLSLGMLFALRIGLNAMGRTNDRTISNRRVLGVERILSQQIAGYIPASGVCFAGAEAPPVQVPVFQGDPQTMRFVSSYSLQEAARGYPQLLEFQVIPGEKGEGVRLVVNELLFTGPGASGPLCAGLAPDPLTGRPGILWRPVVVGPRSFVLADKLAFCRFAYKEERPPAEPDIWHPKWPIYTDTPAAVRIDMAPFLPDPGQLQVPPVVMTFHPNRKPMANTSGYR